MARNIRLQYPFQQLEQIKDKTEVLALIDKKVNDLKTAALIAA